MQGWINATCRFVKRIGRLKIAREAKRSLWRCSCSLLVPPTLLLAPAEEIGDHGNLLEWDKSTYKNALTEHPSEFVHEPQDFGI